MSDKTKRKQPKEPEWVTVLPESDLLVGAGPLALCIYGADNADNRRNVYRNPFGFSFFRHGALIAGLQSSIREELREAQRAARAQQQQPKEKSPAPLPKRRRVRGADEVCA